MNSKAEPNLPHRQKSNINSNKEPLETWINESISNAYVQNVKTITLYNVLTNAHNYEIGRRNVLANLGSIKRN